MAPYNGFAMARCPQCSLVYTAQRDFPPEQYDEIYSSMGAYQTMMAAAQNTAAGEFGFRELWWYKRLALRWLEAAKRAARSKSLFDVGCGPGTFLLVARQRGWTVAGVEPTREPAELGKSFGLAVHYGPSKKSPSKARLPTMPSPVSRCWSTCPDRQNCFRPCANY